GLLMCSEVYVPELARAMALKGAVITLLPAGLWSSELHDTWRTLLWDREPHDHRHEPQHPAGRGRARDRLQSRGDPAGGTPARRLHRDRRPRARPVAPRAGGPPRRPVALADEARHLQAMAPSRGVSGGSAMNDARQGRLGRRDFLTGAAGLALAFPCGAGAQPQGGTLTYASTALPPNIEPHMQGLDI